MGSIRSDLVGVVFVSTEGGDVLRLAAGDAIPEGVTVGDHLIAAKAKAEAVAQPIGSDGTGDNPVSADVKPAAPHTRAPRNRK